VSPLQYRVTNIDAIFAGLDSQMVPDANLTKYTKNALFKLSGAQHRGGGGAGKQVYLVY
jgi:hypothetical protein